MASYSNLARIARQEDRAGTGRYVDAHERTSLTIAEETSPPNRSANLGGFGRLPKKLIDDHALVANELFFLSYRSLYDQEGWGCNSRVMQQSVRAGFSRHVFCRTVRELQDKELLVREQGKRDEPGPGRGYAADRLIFETPEHSFVKVERSLFCGDFTPTEIACEIYLGARGALGAKRWQIAKRFGLSLPTTAKALKRLKAAGRIMNSGTRHVPVYTVVGLHVQGLSAEPVCEKSGQQRSGQQTFGHQKSGLHNKTRAFNKINPSTKLRSQQTAAPANLHKAGMIDGASDTVSGAQLRAEQAKDPAVFANGAVAAAAQAIIAKVVSGKSIARASRFNTPGTVTFYGNELDVPDSVRKQLDKRRSSNVQALVDRAARRKGKGTLPEELWPYVIGIANGDADARARKVMRGGTGTRSASGPDRASSIDAAVFGASGPMGPPEMERLWVDGRARAEGIDPNAVFAVWVQHGGAKDYLDCLDSVRKERARAVRSLEAA